MASNFWLQLKKPILALAPMEGSSRLAVRQAHELLHARPARRAAPCYDANHYQAQTGTGAALAPDSGAKATTR